MNPHHYYGMYRGFVTDVSDPQRLARIMVRIPVIAPPDVETGEYPSFGWAWPAMGFGMGEGIYHMPKVGDQVWVQFEAGDPDRPVYWPGSWTMRAGENNAPLHTQGLYDNSDNFARNPEKTGTSAFPPTGSDQIALWATPAGKVEFNTTPGFERVVVEHKSGSRVEIMPDGTVYIVATGHIKEIAAGGRTSETSGAERHDHGAPVTHNYKGLNESHAGQVTRTYGQVTETAKSVTQDYGKLIQKATAAEIKHYGQSTASYMGGRVEGVFGDYASTISDTAKWVIMNATALTPGVAAQIHVSSPLLGDFEAKVGGSPTDALNNKLLIRHPIGKLPGLSDILLQAVAIAAITAPIITLGPTEGVLGKENAVKGISLLTWLNSHIHPTPSGVSGVPVVPCPATVLSPSVYVW